MNYEYLKTDSREYVTIVTINRPDKLNALNRAVIRELSDCMSSLDKDKQVRCVILTGAGPKAFVAGADIAEFANFSVKEGQNLAAEGQKLLFDQIEAMRTPVIAAINGYALGGGLELAMSCHIRLASNNARMGLPEVSLGVIPGYGGTQRLTELVGRGRAFEMICTGKMITAEEALEYGLVNTVCPQQDLLTLCEKLAGDIVKNSPVAVGFAIEAINAGRAAKTGFLKEIELFGKAFGTRDFKEGTTAFLEKRKPSFPGE
ncbi:MAG: enoyl-CoA hydratase-related protein [Salibacteraceae bacterium]